MAVASVWCPCSPLRCPPRAESLWPTRKKNRRTCTESTAVENLAQDQRRSKVFSNSAKIFGGKIADFDPKNLYFLFKLSKLTDNKLSSLLFLGDSNFCTPCALLMQLGDSCANFPLLAKTFRRPPPPPSCPSSAVLATFHAVPALGSAP